MGLRPGPGDSDLGLCPLACFPPCPSLATSPTSQRGPDLSLLPVPLVMSQEEPSREDGSGTSVFRPAPLPQTPSPKLTLPPRSSDTPPSPNLSTVL